MRRALLNVRHLSRITTAGRTSRGVELTLSQILPYSYARSSYVERALFPLTILRCDKSLS